MTHCTKATCFALILAATAGAQPAKWVDNTLRDFQRFDKEIQDSLLRQLERKIQLHPNPAIQRIVSMQRTHGKLPVGREAPYHRAADWAKDVAPARDYVVGGDERHTAVRERFPAVTILPDLHRAVWYDWGTGQIVRRSRPLSLRQRLENIYNGYPPGSDDALAMLLKKFDNDKKMRKVAHYFSHLYADLNAKVYEDVSLYEAWYSGEMVNVPDVDAIPFERRVLGTRRFKSPIPAGSHRTGLYKKIRDRAFAYRKYRTTREAAAIAYLRADPKMDPMYKLLIPRFQYLYVAHDDDVDAIEKLLRDVPDRDALIAKVDRRLKGSPTEYARRENRERHLKEMFQWLRYWAQLVVFQQTKKSAPGTDK